MTNIEGFQAEDADLTLTIDRSELVQVMMGAKSLKTQIEDGTATAEGNVGVLDQLASAMIDFELGFEVLPGTQGPAAAPDDLNDFEVGAVGIAAE